MLLLAWALALGTVLGCVLAVHYFSEHMHVVSAARRRGISCPGVGGLGYPWHLLSWHRRSLPSRGTALLAAVLTLLPAHQVQQEHGAQGSGAWQREAVLLVLPLGVSLLNVLMPHLYNLLAAWEKQDSPVAEVYVAICR